MENHKPHQKYNSVANEAKKQRNDLRKSALTRDHIETNQRQDDDDE